MGCRVVDLGQDDKDAVGAPGARLDHLIGIEHEVLAQRGQRCCRPRVRQILRRALERGSVGQDGKAGGPARLVGLGECWGIEIGADQSLGRARLLHLGNERGLPCAMLGFNCAGERAHRRGAARQLGQHVERGALLGARYLGQLVACDFL